MIGGSKKRRTDSGISSIISFKNCLLRAIILGTAKVYWMKIMPSGETGPKEPWEKQRGTQDKGSASWKIRRPVLDRLSLENNCSRLEKHVGPRRQFPKRPEADSRLGRNILTKVTLTGKMHVDPAAGKQEHKSSKQNLSKRQTWLWRDSSQKSQTTNCENKTAQKARNREVGLQSFPLTLGPRGPKALTNNF